MSNLNFHAKIYIPTIRTPNTENYKTALNEKIAKNTKSAEKVEIINAEDVKVTEIAESRGKRKNCGKVKTTEMRKFRKTRK